VGVLGGAGGPQINFGTVATSSARTVFLGVTPACEPPLVFVPLTQRRLVSAYALTDGERALALSGHYDGPVCVDVHPFCQARTAHIHTHTYIHTYTQTNKQTNKHRSDATADGSRQWVASGGTEGQVLLWAPGGSNDAQRAEGARDVGRTVQSATDVGSPG
jgi:hypothetical protein